MKTLYSMVIISFMIGVSSFYTPVAVSSSASPTITLDEYHERTERWKTHEMDRVQKKRKERRDFLLGFISLNCFFFPFFVFVYTFDYRYSRNRKEYIRRSFYLSLISSFLVVCYIWLQIK